MKHDRRYQNKEWLEKEYIENGRFLKTIAKECGVRLKAVSYWARKFGLTENKPKNKNTPYKNKKWLYDEYIEKNKPMAQIARDLGVHYETIGRWVTKHKLKKYKKG
jgi:transposase-like protein